MHLFFVREFNDIDHITPIVWRMHRDKFPTAVFCLNPQYDLQGDYRLQFLKAQGVRVNYLFDEFGTNLGALHCFLRTIGRMCFAAAGRLSRSGQNRPSPFSAALHKQILKIGKRIYKYCRQHYYDLHWAQHILEQSAARTVCFDHVNPSRYVAGILLTAAREKSIPTVALPHGVFIYTNNFVRTGSTEEDRYDKFNRFDYVITQNNLRKEVLSRAGVDRDRIHVLGSARYCPEWMAQNRRILPRTMPSAARGSKGLKVVFMTTRFAYRIHVQRMLRTFDLLAGLPGMQIVVKPHTRSGEEAEVYENVALPNVYEYSSVELCEWADVMLVIGSSILIESLVQRKPVLYLKYLHENTTEYEELGACWIIHDEAELKDAMSVLQKDKERVPYSEENILKFLSAIIYGGHAGGDVLGDYENFIVSRAKKSGQSGV